VESKAVYLIYGEQKLLLDEASQRLSKKLYGREEKAALSLQAQEVTGEEIVSHCQSLSFFGEKQLVVVDNCFALKSKDKKALINYLASPNPQTVLLLKAVLLPTEVKKVKSDPLFQAVTNSPYGQTYHYEVKSLSNWIKKEFAGFHKTVSQAQTSYLILTVGEDLLKLRQEIAKIAAYCADKQEVALSDIKAVVNQTVEANVFALIDAIGAGDLETALTLANLILERQEKVDSVVNLIEQQLRLVSLFLIYKAEGITQTEELAKKLSISRGRLFYLKKQAQKFSFPRLKKAASTLLTYDYKRKTQAIDEKVFFEQLIVDLTALLSDRQPVARS